MEIPEKWEEGQQLNRFSYKGKLYMINPPVDAIFIPYGDHCEFLIPKYEISVQGKTRQEAERKAWEKLMYLYNKNAIEADIKESGKFNIQQKPDEKSPLTDENPPIVKSIKTYVKDLTPEFPEVPEGYETTYSYSSKESNNDNNDKSKIRFEDNIKFDSKKNDDNEKKTEKNEGPLPSGFSTRRQTRSGKGKFSDSSVDNIKKIEDEDNSQEKVKDKNQRKQTPQIANSSFSNKQELSEKKQQGKDSFPAGIKNCIVKDTPTKDDQLGYRDYAEAIYKFLISDETDAPLTISIEAPWGAGKTSLMHMIRDYLDIEEISFSKYLYYVDNVLKVLLKNPKLDKEEVKKQFGNLNYLKFYHFIRWLPFMGKAGSIKLKNLENKLKNLNLDKSEIKKILNAIPRKKIKLTIEEAQKELNNFVKGYQEPIIIEEIEQKEKKFLTIWFNAWKYENTEQVWSGLADTIINQLSNRLPPIEREKFLFRLHLSRVDINKIRNDIYNNIFKDFLWYIAFFIGSIIILVTWGINIDWTININNIVATILGVLSGVGILFGGIKRYWENIKVPSISLDKYVNVPDYSEKAGFIHSVEDDLKRAFNLIPDKYKPVVIFIDDLDRCSPENVAKVFEAINLFLGGSFEDCIFIMGIDKNIIATALEKAHKDTYDDMLEQLKKDGVPVGDRYVEKFVQLPFHIPESTKLDKYIASLLKFTSQDDVANIVPENKEKVIVPQKVINNRPVLMEQKEDRWPKNFCDKKAKIRDLLVNSVPIFSNNPRKLKRIFNQIRFLFYIKWVESSTELIQNEHYPEILARWIFILINWPEFAEWLRKIYRDWNVIKEKQLKKSTAPTKEPLRALEDYSLISLEKWQEAISAYIRFFDPEKSPRQVTEEDVQNHIQELLEKEKEWFNNDEIRLFFKDINKLPEEKRLSSLLGENGILP